MIDSTYTVNGRFFRLVPVEEPGVSVAGCIPVVAPKTAPNLAELHKEVSQALNKIATSRCALRGFFRLIQGHENVMHADLGSFEEFLGDTLPMLLAQLDTLDEDASDLEWLVTRNLAALLEAKGGE